VPEKHAVACPARRRRDEVRMRRSAAKSLARRLHSPRPHRQTLPRPAQPRLSRRAYAHHHGAYPFDHGNEKYAAISCAANVVVVGTRSRGAAPRQTQSLNHGDGRYVSMRGVSSANPPEVFAVRPAPCLRHGRRLSSQTALRCREDRTRAAPPARVAKDARQQRSR